jgi:hypothetical protein
MNIKTKEKIEILTNRVIRFNNKTKTSRYYTTVDLNHVLEIKEVIQSIEDDMHDEINREPNAFEE